MSSTRFFLSAIILLLAFAAAIPAHASAAPPSAPDSTLYTTYTIYSNNSQFTVDWSVCGSTQQSEGCYASGSLGPFVAVGAMLEGDPRVNGDVVTRAIYVVDSGSANNVLLYIYKKAILSPPKAMLSPSPSLTLSRFLSQAAALPSVPWPPTPITFSLEPIKARRESKCAKALSPSRSCRASRRP